jgi:quinol monooxygenase YgiN
MYDELDNVVYNVYQQHDEPDTFFIVDGWVSEQVVEAHAAQPNVARIVAPPP